MNTEETSSSMRNTDKTDRPVERLAEAATDAEPGTTVVDLGGPVLTNVHVHLIFWGSMWAGNPFLAAVDVTNAVTSILSGPYMTALSQYRGIGYGTLSGTTLVTTSNPPPVFSDQDVIDLITGLIQAGTVPTPGSDDQLLYCVIMPIRVEYISSGIGGAHNSFRFGQRNQPGSRNVHYAWVMNDGMDSLTTRFSHELVEACTDPEINAFQIPSGTPPHWYEIADVCDSSTAVLNGVVVQPYWSQSDLACVLPAGLPRWTNVVDVTAITGQSIASVFTSWQVLEGAFKVEHLAAMGPDGDLLDFFWSAKQGWQVVNISQITGQQIAGSLTGWQMLEGAFDVEHLATMSPDGDLLIFYGQVSPD